MNDLNLKSPINNSEILAKKIVEILIEKKGLDIKLFNVIGKTSLTDYYVNVTGRSSTQVGSLAYEVVDKLVELGVPAPRIEGKRGNSWILVDFTDCILNVFDSESRSFYNLDRHLPEDSLVDISDIIKEVDERFKI